MGEQLPSIRSVSITKYYTTAIVCMCVHIYYLVSILLDFISHKTELFTRCASRSYIMGRKEINQ